MEQVLAPARDGLGTGFGVRLGIDFAESMFTGVWNDSPHFR